MADGLEGFGQGARRAVAMAALEARELGSARLGTEHLLLGLLAHAEGAAARLLGESGVTLAGARRKVAEASAGRGPDPLGWGRLPPAGGAAARLRGGPGVRWAGARGRGGGASGSRLDDGVESARGGGKGTAGLVRSPRAERAIGRAFRFS